MASTLSLLLVILRISCRIALCFLIADLLVGLVHWAEDSYGSPTWPLVGAAIIAPNLLHHAKPRAFLKNTWWQSADLQVIAGGVVMAVATLCGWLSAELLLVIVLGVNANEFHRWAHRTRGENGRLISFLQDWKLIQGARHHGRHHGGERNRSYCSITCWVDRVLDTTRFWRGMEWLVWRVTGARPRAEIRAGAASS